MGEADELEIVEDRECGWLDALSVLVGLQGSTVAAQVASAGVPGVALSCRGRLEGAVDLVRDGGGPLALYVERGVLALWPERFAGGRQMLLRAPGDEVVYRVLEMDFIGGVSLTIDELPSRR